MDYVYPSGPAQVSANLTAPTPSYKRHAWLAMLGLGIFVAAYVALSGWFIWTSYRQSSVAVARRFLRCSC